MIKSQSPSSFLDIILIAPELKGEGKFCAVCRLVLKHFENKPDFFFSGRRPNTLAYAIASNTMDFYYGNDKPITKREMADRIEKKSITVYTNIIKDSKENYEKFQRKLFKLLTDMKNSKPLDFQ